MNQLENIEQIEQRLWSVADNLRANSNFAANEYFLPVMGLLFLRHAYSHFLIVKEEIVKTLPIRAGDKRELTKEDFIQKNALYLRKQAQFEYLVSLPSDKDVAKAVKDAMQSIEDDYDSLKTMLPKDEYEELDHDVLRNLLRAFNDPALQSAPGDVFGKIYEYFLTKFADQKAHDSGEFFTPQSLVQMIVNIIEPKSGKILDPACGSGGMFVQSAHFLEAAKKNPSEKVMFYGMEKNPTTIRLAMMNLSVHGLEGKIVKAISYYEDRLELQGKVDYVMANPPFNVDEVDGDKIKNDPRLPFGLPGMNDKGKVPNGNYLWISYFYAYLNEKGRSGFVMSSQASSAGNKEMEVRRKLIETGHVDCMMAIRGGFFYTRTVPCELWFFDKTKTQKDKILMIDARNVHRKITRVIYDFSPEQQQNLTSIVWLYRNQNDRFTALINKYLTQTDKSAKNCRKSSDDFVSSLNEIVKPLKNFLAKQNLLEEHQEQFKELQDILDTVKKDFDTFDKDITKNKSLTKSEKETTSIKKLTLLSDKWKPLAEQSRNIVKSIDLLYKLIEKNLKNAEEEYKSKQNDSFDNKKIFKAMKTLEEKQKTLIEALKKVPYYHKQSHLLLKQFPEGKYKDIAGLCKLVSLTEIEKNDWSLTPGRYVGVAPEKEDEDFDFEETMREIHIELKNLDEESATLAKKIQKNFTELGI